MVKPSSPVRVTISSTAWAHATGAAAREPMRETGGLLLGWRTSDGEVHVTDMVEVPDPRARHTAYRRRHARAQAALGEALASEPTQSPVGYVGEWHTHPAPVGPSWVDHRAIRRISKKSPETVALVVCAYNSSTNRWTPIAQCAANGRVATATLELENGSPDD